MSKADADIEKYCLEIAQELVGLVNMKNINSLIQQYHNEKDDEQEFMANIIRTSLVGIKISLDNTRDLMQQFLRQNKKGDAKLLRVTLERNLQHCLTYYLSQTDIHEYIINNWDGKYRELIFQHSSPIFIYKEEWTPLIVNKKLYTEDAMRFVYNCFILCWEDAYENLRNMEAEYLAATEGKKPPGRKKKRPIMEQVYLKEFLETDLVKLKDKEYILFNQRTFKWEWKKSMKKLSQYFWKAKNKERFIGGFTNPEIGAAFLDYFSIPETKANMYYFSQGYYESNFTVNNHFPL